MGVVDVIRARVTGGNRAEDWVRAVYQEYAHALLQTVTRWTSGDRQLAEDVVQETLVRAWRSHEQLTSNPASLRPWLYTVAKRIVIDEHRRRTVRPDEVGDDPHLAFGVDDGTDAMLRSVVMHEAMLALSDKHRDVLREVYFLGRSTHEAAEVLGIPRGTVLSRTYYALKALRLALAERGVTDLTVG